MVEFRGTLERPFEPVVGERESAEAPIVYLALHSHVTGFTLP